MRYSDFEWFIEDRKTIQRIAQMGEGMKKEEIYLEVRFPYGHIFD